MGTSQPGSILALIGGILGIVWGVVLLFAGSLVGALLGPLGAFPVVIGIWLIATAIVVIVASRWMKDPAKCFRGGLVVLILSVVGGGTILGLIGGILGLIAGKKAN
ncbi:hypothetical protein HYU22_04490 [Candidatus Woesearchaeota archaeon]|nr:hypothetical protein [Candidatus Woesearchaeota archaeon]